MFKNKDWFCKGSYDNLKNEDCVGYSSNFIYAIDGATCLSGRNIFSSTSDAQWFANRLSEYLGKYLGDLTKSIPTILYLILKQIKKEFDTQSNKQGVTIDYPSASIIIFRENNNKIEMYRLGDCLGIVKFKSGRTDIIEEKMVAYLDNLALTAQYNKALALNISVKEARPLINDILIENRKKRNTIGGYWILDPTAVGVEHGEYKFFCKDKVESISVMTDGYFSIVTVYKIIKSFKLLQEQLKKGKMANLYTLQYYLQDKDCEFSSYPRFKLRDDSGVVYAEIF